MQLGLPVYIGSLAVLAFLLISTTLLSLMGANPIEALYLITLAAIIIGNYLLERGRQKQ